MNTHVLDSEVIIFYTLDNDYSDYLFLPILIERGYLANTVCITSNNSNNLIMATLTIPPLSLFTLCPLSITNNLLQCWLPPY